MDIRRAQAAHYGLGAGQSGPYHTDEWEAYKGVLPTRAHRPSPKGSVQTSIVEAINCSLRQRCAVLVGKSCSFSRCLAMHHVRIQLVIDEHNRRCTID